MEHISEVKRMDTDKNFREVETEEEANAIDMRIWKFVTYDGGRYVFARRAKPLVK
jgi:hypothetical protein